MNIDKIYKPLKLQRLKFDEQIYPTAYYMPRDVKELEEKYKESLDFIYHILDCVDTDTWGIEVIKDFLERHTGMKWEDIIK